MKRKQLVSLGLAATLTVSALTACGGSAEETKAPAEKATTATTAAAQAGTDAASQPAEAESKGIEFPLKETMTFTGMTGLFNDQYLLSDNIAWKETQEKNNIKFNLIYELPGGEAKEKSKLIMAGGDYPDFVYKAKFLGDEMVNKSGMDGVLIPLEDLIREYAPNIKRLYDERNAWVEMAAADGHIYSLPVMKEPEMYGVSNGIWMINQKWMDNLGLEMPTNMDELYQVLKAFKEQDANGNGDPNDEIPMTGHTGSVAITYALLGYIGDGVQYVGEYVSVIDGQLVFYPYTDGYKEYLSDLRQMYAEGLIDVNALTQTLDQEHALFQSGDVVGMGFAVSPTYFREENHADYAALMPFVPENFPLSTGINPSAFVITDKCENPEVLIAWIDQFYSEEGWKLGLLGIEGETYKNNDDGTFTRTVDKEKYPNKGAYALDGRFAVPLWWHPDYYFKDANITAKPSDAFTADKYRDDGVYGQGTMLLTLKYTEEENEQVSSLTADIWGYIENYAAQAICGEVDIESSWDDFQKTLKSMGADDLLAIQQAAYARNQQ